MKQKHDYLVTSLWYKEKIKDPFQVIAAAFSFADMTFYRKLVKRLLQTAHSEKVYSKDSPGNLLFDMKMLESLINAAYLIVKQKHKSPLVISASDIMNKNTYFGGRPGDEWDFLPHSLSKKEFSDPYLVFTRFFEHQPLDKWKKDLEEVLNYSLSNNAHDDVEIDFLSLYLYLNKIVEAAHLIDVREVIHIEGRLRNRFKSIH